MKPNNNSDNDLLVWADWLDENGYEHIAEEVRDEVENPAPEVAWQYQAHTGGDGVGGICGIDVGSAGGGRGDGVGGNFSGVGNFGGDFCFGGVVGNSVNRVGGAGDNVGGV